MKRQIHLMVCLLLMACAEDSEHPRKSQLAELQKMDSTILHSASNDSGNDWLDPETDTTYFEKGSFLYWQSNSDSSWLTFETKTGVKSILNSDYIGYWDRLGMQFVAEYDHYLFFVERWISGCCTMPDFILLDKGTGKEIKRVATENAIFSSSDDDYLLYFKDSTMNEMVYMDLLSNKIYPFNIQKYDLLNTAKDCRVVNSTDFFLFIDYPRFQGNEVTIVLKHLPKNSEGEYAKDSIVFVRG